MRRTASTRSFFVACILACTRAPLRGASFAGLAFAVALRLRLHRPGLVPRFAPIAPFTTRSSFARPVFLPTTALPLCSCALAGCGRTPHFLDRALSSSSRPLQPEVSASSCAAEGSWTRPPTPSPRPRRASRSLPRCPRFPPPLGLFHVFCSPCAAGVQVWYPGKARKARARVPHAPYPGTPGTIPIRSPWYLGTR